MSNLEILTPSALNETPCVNDDSHRWFMTPIIQFTLDFACNRCGRTAHMSWQADFAGHGFSDIYEFARERLGADFVEFTTIEQLREDFSEIAERLSNEFRVLALGERSQIPYTSFAR